MAREKRTFRAHEKLLVDVIKRQAGSLWKAIVEAVSNAVDSHATRCDIDISTGIVRITDNGNGFQSVEQIEQFFEVFGTPHTAEEEKTYGQFRMGRGQLFAFGRNVWRSGTFEMTVDINKDGLDYHLRTELPEQPGCTITIELYQPLSNVDAANTRDLLELNVKYVPIQCMLGNRQINKDRNRQQWTLETEQADIKLNGSAALIVYNQGIKVCSISHSRFGTGGEVVSKQPLLVNFARNDIIESCPVWAEIIKSIRAQIRAPQATGTSNAQTQRTRRRRTTEADRRRMVNEIKDGHYTRRQVNYLKLLELYGSRRNMSPRQIWNVASGNIAILSNMPDSSNIGSFELAEQASLAGVCCVLSLNNLARWGVASHAQLVQLLNSHCSTSGFTLLTVQQVLERLSNDHLIIGDDKLPELSRATLEVIRRNLRYLSVYVPSERRFVDIARNKRIVAGVGTSEVFTDGSSYIALSSEFLRRFGFRWDSWGCFAAKIALISQFDRPACSATNKITEFNSSQLLAYEAIMSSLVISRFSMMCALDMVQVAQANNIRLRTSTARDLDTLIANLQATITVEEQQ